MLDTPLVMIEDDEALLRACQSFANEPVLGVDTESDSMHHPSRDLARLSVAELTRPCKLEGLDYSKTNRRTLLGRLSRARSARLHTFE